MPCVGALFVCSNVLVFLGQLCSDSRQVNLHGVGIVNQPARSTYIAAVSSTFQPGHAGSSFINQPARSTTYIAVVSSTCAGTLLGSCEGRVVGDMSGIMKEPGLKLVYREPGMEVRYIARGDPAVYRELTIPGRGELTVALHTVHQFFFIFSLHSTIKMVTDINMTYFDLIFRNRG